MITNGLILAMCLIYGLGVPIPNFGNQPVNYVLRSFFHGSLVHLLANMLTFYQLKDLSNNITQTEYIGLLFFLLISSSLILYGFDYFNNQKKISIGFSAVLFGLLILSNHNKTQNLLLVSTNQMIKILPQILIPGISFWGHLSGIIAGIVYILLKMP